MFVFLALKINNFKLKIKKNELAISRRKNLIHWQKFEYYMF